MPVNGHVRDNHKQLVRGKNVNFLKTEGEKLELAKARADKAESEVAKQVAKTRGWWLT